MKDVILKIEKNKVIISGFITFENVVEILDLCIKKTTNLENIEIDLKNLNNSNSSVLLFIINYIKHAIKSNKQIHFINIPHLLLELSAVYNLNTIINKKVKKNETHFNN